MTPPLMPLTPRQQEKARAQKARIVKRRVQRRLTIAERATQLPRRIACYVLAELMGTRTGDVAKALGVHPTTVRSALRRIAPYEVDCARKALRQLERETPEEEPWWKK